eukprot:TRINITY_DN5095_c0_g1_i1.p1 TRINITY_DN5095_c0_g1~~TRINITY_DN5095_c0_g1_i1.p1  ORF type:complete len:206 (+),score=27.87 TRINITY_DN5095_c0_g1_i1:119-736(+)
MSAGGNGGEYAPPPLPRAPPPPARLLAVAGLGGSAAPADRARYAPPSAPPPPAPPPVIAAPTIAAMPSNLSSLHPYRAPGSARPGQARSVAEIGAPPMAKPPTSATIAAGQVGKRPVLVISWPHCPGALAGSCDRHSVPRPTFSSIKEFPSKVVRSSVDSKVHMGAIRFDAPSQRPISGPVGILENKFVKETPRILKHTHNYKPK